MPSRLTAARARLARIAATAAAPVLEGAACGLAALLLGCGGGALLIAHLDAPAVRRTPALRTAAMSAHTAAFHHSR